MPSAALLSGQVASSSPPGRMEQRGTDAEMPPGPWPGDSVLPYLHVRGSQWYWRATGSNTPVSVSGLELCSYK